MSSSFLRRKARQYAAQAIYQWQMTGASVSEMVAEFSIDHSPKKFDVLYFESILQGVTKNIEPIDTAITPYINRALKDLDPVELAILRLASFELLFMLDVPYKVIINEAVELSKRYGATDAHKFINGVLDKIANDKRKAEKDLLK